MNFFPKEKNGLCGCNGWAKQAKNIQNLSLKNNYSIFKKFDWVGGGLCASAAVNVEYLSFMHHLAPRFVKTLKFAKFKSMLLYRRFDQNIKDKKFAILLGQISAITLACGIAIYL